MDDPSRHADADGDTDDGAERERGPESGRPRWQKVVGIIGLLVLLGLGLLMFGPGGDGHGPGRHAPIENQEREGDTGSGRDHEPPPWAPAH